MVLILRETCQQYYNRRIKEGWKEISRDGYKVILLSPDGNIKREIDLRNDVLTLRPNASGDETNIESQYPDSGEHWDKVDEELADDDGTYVYTTRAFYQRDLYKLPTVSGSGTINFIKIYFRARQYPSWGFAYIRPSLKINSTVTDGTEIELTDTYTTYSEQWNNNPANGKAWEWADINTLQIGISMKIDTDIPPPPQARCTQVYVEIDYTSGPSYEDSGLRYSDGQNIYKIAATSEDSPLRIWAGEIRDIALVDTDDANASPLRIKTKDGVKALRKYTS